MRTGKSTINGGKRRMETSKAIVERDKPLKVPREDGKSRNVEGSELKDEVYGV